MKRKLLTWFLAASLAVTGAIGLASCANGEQPEEPNKPVEPGKPEEPNKPVEPDVQTLTCAEAIVKANEIGETESEERFIIKGKVKSVKSAQFGKFTIEDSTGELFVFHSFNADGTIAYNDMTDRPVKGDDITIKTKLHAFKGNGEAVDAWIIDFKHQEIPEDSSYTKMTITEARNAAVNTKVEVEGTVAFITKGQKNVLDGFYLISDSDSIYVFDGDLANQVKVGNKITLRGTKKMFILPKEQSFADKYGYTGSCQIDTCQLVKNDNGNNTIDLSFAEEITIKELINKPNNENYTTKTFKVNAYVNKVVSREFVNYYINDLDNKTGSYVYTQNSGADFAYLDEFDGKICTVYLAPHNMKSSAAGCVQRYIPLAVKNENYKFDLTKTNDFVLEYELKDLFRDAYNVNVDIEVPTSYKNDDLGINNVKIEWSTSTPELVTIDSKDNTVIKLTNAKLGDAKIKAKITYNGVSLEHEFTIKMVETPKFDSINVKSAIDSLNQVVTVKGIAGPSLINQTGFYLIDESGVIVVRINEKDMNQVKMGQLVTIKGKVLDFSSNAKATKFMRIINEAELLLNEFGKHNYETTSFLEKDFNEILTIAKEATALSCAQAYKTKLVIKSVEDRFSVNYFLCRVEDLDKDFETEIKPTGQYISIYNNGDQSDYLLPYCNKEITVEFTLCNYNGKDYYSAGIISASDGVNTVYPMRNYQ